MKLLSMGKKLAVRTVAAALNLHTTEDLTEAKLAVQGAMEKRLDAFAEENQQLREDLARAMETRTSEAVDHLGCDRCGAGMGERCRDSEGKPLRRTHRERTEAWRNVRHAEPLQDPDRLAEGGR